MVNTKWTKKEIDAVNKEYDRFYGYTYKCIIKVDPQREDYLTALQALRLHGDIIEMRFETDSKDKLHIHGIIRFRRTNPYFKRMVPKGYTTRFEPLLDYDGWMRYISKQSPNREESEQLADSVYFRTNYIQ